MSPHHLQRRFKAIVGLSPREFQSAVRAGKLRTSLRDGRDVTTAIYEAGYGSPSRVYEAAPTGKGMSLSNYRRGGAGMRIGYSMIASPVGSVLVAATDNGVCAVKIGDSESALVRDLRREYPAADIAANLKPRSEWVKAIAEAPARRRAVARPADRRSRHRVPVEGVARAAAHSVRRDPGLRRGRPEHRQAEGGSGGRRRLREESRLPRRSVPSGRTERRGHRGISLGRALGRQHCCWRAEQRPRKTAQPPSAPPGTV